MKIRCLCMIAAVILLLGACGAEDASRPIESSAASGGGAEETPLGAAPAAQGEKSLASAASPAKPQPMQEPAAQAGDWLFARGNQIVDGDGRAVWITGVNWFGYNTGTNTFDGLWSANLRSTVEEVANRGFNLIRVPFSAALINQWAAGEYPKANLNEWENKELAGKNSLEIFDAFLGCCKESGLKVMIDIHSANTDAMGHLAPMWYSDSVTAEDYFAALRWIAARYKEDDTLIAIDLKNEPHGKAEESPRAIWNGSDSPDNWRHVATQAALKVMGENPNLLIVIEGVEIYPKDIAANGDFSSQSPGDYHYNWWGGNLRGVAHCPVDLGEYQNKVVYSPHDYGPAVYGQPWFQGGFTFDSLYRDCWRDNWMFIHEEGTAPLLIGEWGGFLEGDNLEWMKHLRTLIVQNKLHHTFWCLNANSGDTGGLLGSDFVTWDEEKYAFVRESLWQRDGKFIGLSGSVPLGESGLRRTDA